MPAPAVMVDSPSTVDKSAAPVLGSGLACALVLAAGFSFCPGRGVTHSLYSFS